MPVDIKKKKKLGENTQQKHLYLFFGCAVKKPLLKEDRECDASGFCLSLSLIISVMAIPTILRHSFRLSLCDSKRCEIALNNKLH